MEIFKDLEIEGGPESLKKCMEIIGKSLKGDWARDNKKEENYLKDMGGITNTKELFCVSCPKGERYPAATIWLFRDDGCIEVGNIVPTTVGQITAEEYNHIVDDFYNKFVKDAVDFTGVSLVVRGGKVDAGKLFGPSVAQALKFFSVAANKSTGSSHPCDMERWLDFIILTHLNDKKISTTHLRDWLIGEGWSDEVASDLISEYEFAKYLLRAYDARKIKK